MFHFSTTLECKPSRASYSAGFRALFSRDPAASPHRLLFRSPASLSCGRPSPLALLCHLTVAVSGVKLYVDVTYSSSDSHRMSTYRSRSRFSDPLTPEDVLAVAKTLQKNLDWWGLPCGLVGSAACFLYGQRRTPNVRCCGIAPTSSE